MHQNILSQSKYLYFKIVCVLCVVVIALYLFEEPRVAPNGGTFLGYTLGVIALLIIIFLIIFGIRKRSYKSNLGDLKHWLSAHVWFGLALVVIATLHTGFQFGFNIHTVAYVLMMLVVISGIWGVYMYLNYPPLLSDLLNSKTIVQQGEVLIAIDQSAYQMLGTLSDLDEATRIRVEDLLNAAANEPIILQWSDRLKTDVTKTNTYLAMQELESLFLTGKVSVRNLSLAMVKRVNHLQQIRDFIQLKTLMSFWLLFHVPISIGLLATLMAHIFSVFYYW